MHIFSISKRTSDSNNDNIELNPELYERLLDNITDGASNCSSPNQGYATREQPFECNICPKQFTRKDILTQHTNIHPGARRF